MPRGLGFRVLGFRVRKQGGLRKPVAKRGPKTKNPKCNDFTYFGGPGNPCTHLLPCHSPFSFGFNWMVCIRARKPQAHCLNPLKFFKSPLKRDPKGNYLLASGGSGIFFSYTLFRSPLNPLQQAYLNPKP